MIVQKVLVVGAGLAGLSAAIALAKRGVAVTIATLDARAEGASITITNRAVDAVEALGALDACVAEGLTPANGQSIFSAMWDDAGNALPVPTPPVPATRLPAYIAIYRPDLSRILTEAAETAGVAVRTGLSFSALVDCETHVDVAFTDGTHERFDLVVGADGAHSAVRGIIHPGLNPTYTGWMSFRMVLDEGPEGPAGFYTLPNGTGMVATVRLPGNRLYMAAGMRMENRRLDQAEAATRLDAVLTPYSAPLVRAIRDRLCKQRDAPQPDATPFDRIGPDVKQPHVIARPFEYLLVPAPWHRGRVTVIGDAAHATTPNLASGGSIALEDGVVLAEELARHDSVPGALDAFMTRRFARCAMVVETSVAMMQQADSGGGPADNARLRSAAMAELVQPY